MKLTKKQEKDMKIALKGLRYLFYTALIAFSVGFSLGAWIF